MILIQDASQGPNIDKPLRIIGDPYKVQVEFCVFVFLFFATVFPFTLTNVTMMEMQYLTHRSS